MDETFKPWTNDYEHGLSLDLSSFPKGPFTRGPNSHPCQQVPTFEPKEAIKIKYLHGTWDLGLAWVNCKVPWTSPRIPSPMQKSWGISWELLSSWKHVLTLFSDIKVVDERRKHTLATSSLFVVINFMSITLFFGSPTQFVMYKQNVEMMLMAVFIFKEGRPNTRRSIWEYCTLGAALAKKQFKK